MLYFVLYVLLEPFYQDSMLFLILSIILHFASFLSSEFKLCSDLKVFYIIFCYELQSPNGFCYYKRSIISYHN